MLVTASPVRKDHSWADPVAPELSADFFVPGQVVKYEVMTPNSTGNHLVYKDFQHYRVVVPSDPGCSGARASVRDSMRAWTYTFDVPSCYAGWRGGSSSEDIWEPWLVPFINHPLFPSDTSGLYPIVGPPPNHEELRLNALRAMMPGVRARLSLLNSLYELKDMVSVPHTLRKIRDFVRLGAGGLPLKQALAQLLSRAGRRNLAAIANEQSKRAADAFLQLEFNVLPLISDICSFHTALRSASKDISRLLANAGQPITSHWGKNFEFSEEGSTEWSAATGPTQMWPWSDCASYCTTRWSKISCEYHATMQYDYSLTAFQVEHAQLLGYLDELGVNLNPRIIWAAIPWTFVIDWVVGVSRWLDQLKVRNMDPIVHILQWCDSVRYTRTYDGSKTIWSTLGKLTNNAPMPRATEQAYRRFTDFPSYNSFITSGLSPMEMSLGAALLRTRNWSRYKRQH